MRYVFDTSAFVKLLVQEPETPAVQGYLKQATHLAASRLVMLETEAALQRRLRESILTQAEVTQAQKIAQTLLSSFHLFTVDGALPLAQKLIQTAGPLRTLDAIHLATAQTLSAPLVAFDRQLRQAAERAGVPTLP